MRLYELQTAFLTVKLKYLDRIKEYRRRIAARHLNEIKNGQIKLPEKSRGMAHVWHIFAIRCLRRKELAQYFEK